MPRSWALGSVSIAVVKRPTARASIVKVYISRIKSKNTTKTTLSNKRITTMAASHQPLIPYIAIARNDEHFTIVNSFCSDEEGNGLGRYEHYARYKFKLVDMVRIPLAGITYRWLIADSRHTWIPCGR
jgi:hypothetical protein